MPDISTAGSATADIDTPRRTLRKVMWRLVPFTALLYLLAYLDRVNIGFAALTMNADLGLTATAYGAAAGVFSLSYTLLAVPSNIALAKFGARTWLACIMITWGIVSAAIAFVHGPYLLFALRFLLGAAESGLLPGILFYLSQWIPVTQRARVMGGFFMAVPIAFVVGAPLSTSMLDLGWLSIKGWQWMFIIEGLASSITGLAILRILADRPKNVRWLTNDERSWLENTLAAEYAARGGNEVAALRHGLTNPRVWLLGVMYAGPISALGSFGYWLPLIIRSLGGLTNFEVGLITAAPYAAATLFMLPWSRHSDATGELKWHVCLPMLLASAGFALGALAGDPKLAIVLLGITVVCVLLVPAVFWTMATRSLNGPAAAAGIALINCIANIGGYIGPQVMGYLKDATKGYQAGLFALSGLMLLATILGLALGRQRR